MASTTAIIGYLSSDIIFFLVALIFFVGFIMFFGKKTAVSVILSFYPATILYNFFPFTQKLVIFSDPQFEILNKLIIFLILFVPICIIIDRYVADSEYSSSVGILRVAGFSLAFLILIVLFSYAVASYDTLHNFGPQIDALFAGTDRIFYWSLAPLIILGFL